MEKTLRIINQLLEQDIMEKYNLSEKLKKLLKVD